VAGRLAGVPVRLGSFRGDARVFRREPVLRWFSHASLDAVVANSRATAANGPRLPINRAAVRIVPNGVSADGCASPQEIAEFRARLGCAGDAPIVGGVGRLDGNKNFPVAIRAFASIAGRHPNAVLVIAGPGPDREELRGLAARLGLDRRVILAGPVPGIARYFGTFRVLCHTSRREGMPNVLLEAAARGIPAVATRAGASAEVVEHGVTGYLVEQGDVAAISGYLDRLLSDPALAATMGAAAYRKVTDAFPVDAMIAGMTRVYDEALAGTL
jgi:glycosyltransferase involved in cell wall biosynthesis